MFVTMMFGARGRRAVREPMLRHAPKGAIEAVVLGFSAGVPMVYWMLRSLLALAGV